MRMAYWFGFAAVAGAFGGLVAFGVQHIHASVSNWRLLFIIEGCPTVLLGLAAMFLLPDRPEETTYLNEQERQLAIERMNRGLKADVGRTVNKSGCNSPVCQGGTLTTVSRAHHLRFQGLEGRSCVPIAVRCFSSTLDRSMQLE